MAYTRFANGFNVTTSSAIDKRFILTKAEMLTAEDDYNLPDVYFAMCKDNGKMYVYSKTASYLSDTGRYHPIEDFIDFMQSPQAKANFEEDVKKTGVVSDLDKLVKGDSQNVGLVDKVAELQEQITTLVIDGTEVK